jgi:uncharacterized membrane protein
MATPWLLKLIEDNTPSIDRIINAIHRPVARFMREHPRIRRALDGTWLGHPLHPAIITVPIGAWTTAVILDIANIVLQIKACGTAADLSYLIGLGGAGAALVTGLTEWSYLEGNARRVTFVHAMSNTIAATLITTSLVLRMAGFRGIGFLVALVAVGAVGFGGWLGGELAYHYGAGVGRISSDERE